jgi:hypothetical protein
LINPVVVKAKILLQQIWLLKLDWDKPVPEEIATSWKLFVDELTELNKFRIPRKLIISNLPINLIELHGFADASSKAYGAAVYVKATDVAGNSSITLYILRFVNNLKNKTKNQKALSFREFADEIRCMQKSKKLKCQRLAKLDPFIDKNGLLRVGGRLKHSLLAYESKFPILLPEKHHVTKWIIRETHKDELHAGNEATPAAVRQRYWPISGRNIVRKVIHSCVKCNRANPKPISQKMGDLPKERLQPSRPFSTSGVDYAGPYLIKSSKLRNAKMVKSYIALFVCFSTKAVHLELVGDLTTESFLAAFKRFTSRKAKYFLTTIPILLEPSANF